jgi:hypothetical protein
MGPARTLLLGSALALAACRGGVKSGLRAWDPSSAAAPQIPAVVPSPTPVPPPIAAPALAGRIEYFQISDG